MTNQPNKSVEVREKELSNYYADELMRNAPTKDTKWLVATAYREARQAEQDRIFEATWKAVQTLGIAIDKAHRIQDGITEHDYIDTCVVYKGMQKLEKEIKNIIKGKE